MKYFYSCLTALVMFVSPAFSQVTELCGIAKMQKAMREAHPEILIEEARLQQFVADWIASHPADLRDNAEYTIPIVFHIIHDYGSENISDDQVRDAVRILNEDYQKMNADTSDIVTSFKSIASNAKIQFRLANLDNSGNCTTGIEHIHSLLTYQGGDDAKLNDWPRNKYLNIWTVKTFSNDLEGVAGYAYLPPDVSNAGSAAYDGVIILSSYIGSIGTGYPSTSRALTHEIGHVLGLPHTWGNTNSPGVACGDDGFDDTPETKGWTSCNLTGSVCNPPVIENVQNFMEYSYCSDMFTQDQASEMQAVLNSPTAGRNNLSTTSNLDATGTDDTIEPLCAPKADFFSNYTLTCQGTSIYFHDVSWGGASTSRNWTFQDGVPATSTDEDPLVSFTSPGWKNVTLTVTNSIGSNTKTLTKAVFISDASVPQYPVAYWEGFSSPTTFTTDWIVQNREGNGSTFTRVTNAGYNSTQCVKLNNYHNMTGDIDNLITPSFDLSSGGPLYLNFRYSGSSNTSGAASRLDVLNVYSSTNCGQNWALRSSIKNEDLANAGYYSSAFTPSSASQWVSKSIALPSSLFESNVRFKFEYKSTNGKGNNFYLDDVQIQNNPVGVNDPDAATFALKVQPNPFTDNAIALVHQQVTGQMNVRILDITGRMVFTVFNGTMSEGEHSFSIDKEQLGGSGIYFLIADDGITLQREKVVVQ